MGYNVYRAISIDDFTLGALNGTTALTETTYTDTTASDNVTYYYTVTAVDPNGNESEPAVIVDAILNEVAVSVNNTNLIDNIVTRNRFFVGSYAYTENDTTQTHNALGIAEFTPTTNSAYDVLGYIIFYQTDNTILNTMKFEFELYNPDEYTGDHAFGLYESCMNSDGSYCSDDTNQDGEINIFTLPITSENYSTIESETIDSFTQITQKTVDGIVYDVIESVEINLFVSNSGVNQQETNTFYIDDELLLLLRILIEQMDVGNTTPNWSAVATFINSSDYTGNFEDHLSDYGMTLDNITDNDEDGVYASEDCDDDDENNTAVCN